MPPRFVRVPSPISNAAYLDVQCQACDPKTHMLYGAVQLPQRAYQRATDSIHIAGNHAAYSSAYHRRTYRKMSSIPIALPPDCSPEIRNHAMTEGLPLGRHCLILQGSHRSKCSEYATDSRRFRRVAPFPDAGGRSMSHP